MLEQVNENNMADIPQEKPVNSLFGLMRDGYTYIGNRARAHNSDIFRINLLGKKVICITGEEAARLFYDTSKFMRKGAVPKRVQKTLFGKRAIHTLDNASHRHRKAMFMSVMFPENIQRLTDLVTRNWYVALRKWESMDKVVLFKESQKVMCRAACAWTGVPLQADEVKKRTNDFVAMIDAFGALGARWWRGKKARKRTEKWIRKAIDQARKGSLIVPEESPLFGRCLL